ALFTNVYYLIIDEKSIVGLTTLAWLNIRCREIFLAQASYPFSSLNIILASDFY
ncbi:hypothetical protein CC80DRAFT_417725, partial [Byssothecium circinans]